MPDSPKSQVRSFHLDAPCARVFPLFTPLGERAWAAGWNPEILSGNEERGSVFRTRAHDEETIWIVSAYEPEQHRVSYARLKQGSNFGLVDVDCRESDSGGSEIRVRYTLTGVSPAGEPFVREFLDDARYDRFIDEWQRALGAALSPRKESAG